MNTLILLALIAVYLLVGFTVVRKIGFSIFMGEAYAFLAFLWPILLTGIGARIFLKKISF
jgi:hypothetical protein